MQLKHAETSSNLWFKEHNNPIKLKLPTSSHIIVQKQPQDSSANLSMVSRQVDTCGCAEQKMALSPWTHYRILMTFAFVSRSKANQERHNIWSKLLFCLLCPQIVKMVTEPAQLGLAARNGWSRIQRTYPGKQSAGYFEWRFDKILAGRTQTVLRVWLSGLRLCVCPCCEFSAHGANERPWKISQWQLPFQYFKIFHKDVPYETRVPCQMHIVASCRPCGPCRRTCRWLTRSASVKLWLLWSTRSKQRLRSVIGHEDLHLTWQDFTETPGEGDSQVYIASNEWSSQTRFPLASGCIRSPL